MSRVDMSGRRDGKLGEQYRMYVETADKNSTRRLETNRFYVTVLSLLLISLPFVADSPFANETAIYPVMIIISLFSVVLSSVWAINISSYRNINRCKFVVIKSMERTDNHLFNCYGRERDELEEGFHLPQSYIEQLVPISLIIFHIGLIFYVLGIIAN